MDKSTVAALAYTAGLIDGEGCIRIVRGAVRSFKTGVRQTDGTHTSYILEVRVGMIDEDVIRWLAGHWGGRVYKFDPKGRQWRPIWTWQIAAESAGKFLDTILPCLIAKREQAQVALDFQRIKKHYWGKWTQPSADYEKYYLRLKALKRLRAAATTKPSGPEETPVCDSLISVDGKDGEGEPKSLPA